MISEIFRQAGVEGVQTDLDIVGWMTDCLWVAFRYERFPVHFLKAKGWI